MEQLARELEEKRRQELERLKEEELKNSEQGKRKTGKDQENALRGKAGLVSSRCVVVYRDD